MQLSRHNEVALGDDIRRKSKWTFHYGNEVRLGDDAHPFGIRFHCAERRDLRYLTWPADPGIGNYAADR
jgi:hypothetical protein